MFSFEEDFSKSAQKLRAEFDQAALRAQGHPGETGSGREAALMEFLRGYLQRRYSVGSGFIRDTSGKRSKQVDVIVNDEMIFASFPYDQYRGLYICESVACAIQVKSILDKNELKNCIENLLSVKQLRRKHHTADLRVGRPSERADIILCYVFAYKKSTSLKTLKHNWIELNEEVCPNREDQIDAVVILDEGMIFNIPEADESFYIKAGDEIKRGVVVVETKEDTLLDFYSHLLFHLPRFIFVSPYFSEYVDLKSYSTY